MKNNAVNSGDTVTISRAEYEQFLKLKEENEQLSKLNDWFLQQLTLAKQKKYGSTSEKADDAIYEQLSLLADEPEMIEYLESIRKKETVIVASHTRTRKTGAIDDVVPDDVPVEVEEHRPDDIICSVCGAEMTEIGKEVKRTLKIIPAQVVVHEDWYFTYACKSCEEENCTTQIRKTPRDVSVLPGSYASPEAIAYIMTQKYVMGCPLYRQESDFNRRNIRLSRQTMSNWLLESTERWLEPVYNELHRKLLEEDIIHADETELQVLREPGKAAQSTSYMWLYRTGKYAEHPIVLYEYQAGRGGDYAMEFLKGFSGYLQTDGYSGYNKVTDVTHVGCMAHLRRKFDDVIKSQPKGSKSPLAAKAEAYCSKIFKIEEDLANLSSEERFEQRKILVKPIMDEFEKFMEGKNAGSKSKLGQAITYYNNQWSTISNFMLDGRLEVSNNLAERSIKPFVTGRKNFLFANTPKGAKGTAIMFSIIETAKDNHLDPYRYITYLLTKAPSLDQNIENWVESLLPENAPDSCRIPK